MKKLSLLVAAACLSGTVGATDLPVHRMALDNDPQFLAARYQQDAGQEKEAQGLSGLLPTLGVSANTQWNDVDRELRGSNLPKANAKYNSNGYTATLTQPLFAGRTSSVTSRARCRRRRPKPSSRKPGRT